MNPSHLRVPMEAALSRFLKQERSGGSARSGRRPRAGWLILCLLSSMALTHCGKVLPFSKQTFRAIDDKMVVVLTSSDEMELRNAQANLICKYSDEGSRIRAAVTMMGTTQAVYFQVTPDGLVGPEGDVLYNPQRYSVVMAQVEAERAQARLDQALFNAVASGQADAVQSLLKQGARINALTRDGKSPLYIAVKAGQIDSVKALLAANADPNFADSDGNSCLMLAADKGGQSSMFRPDRTDVANPIIGVLLEHGATLNAQNKDGETALMIATSAENYAGMRVLVAAGANREIKDGRGRTVLDRLDSKRHLLMSVENELESLRTENEREFLRVSRTAQNMLGAFQEFAPPYGLRKQEPLSKRTEISDVGLESVGSNNNPEIKLWFGSIKPGAVSKRDSGNQATIFGKSTPQYEVVIEGARRSLLFLDAQERDNCFETLKSALVAWSAKYGDPSRIPNPNAKAEGGAMNEPASNNARPRHPPSQWLIKALKTMNSG